MPGKLGVTSTQRKTMLRNLASDLLWYGKITTTLARAKELRSYVEKIITLAVNSYTDTISETVTVKDEKGKETTKKVFKKLSSKKTYYVKVRSYKKVSGKTYYGAYCKTKSVKIK